MVLKYAPGPYLKSIGLLLQEQIANMLLEQYAFQIWCWSLFDLEGSSRLLITQDHMVLSYESRPKSGLMASL